MCDEKGVEINPHSLSVFTREASFPLLLLTLHSMPVDLSFMMLRREREKAVLIPMPVVRVSRQTVISRSSTPVRHERKREDVSSNLCVLHSALCSDQRSHRR